MKRTKRSVLRALGTGFIASLTGCTAHHNGTETPTKTTSPTPTKSSTATTTESPTPTPYGTLKTERTYAFAEWHTRSKKDDSFSFTVDSVILATTYQFDGTEQEMPESDQLAFVTLRLKNVGDSKIHVYGRSGPVTSWAVVAEDRWHRERRRLSGEPVHNLERVGFQNAQRYSAEGQRIKPGETVQEKVVCIVPRSLSRTDLEVGFDPTGDDETLYPLRWLPGRAKSER
ncbi:MAG: hypothetical protein ABEH81_12045 [Halopenitus sp.]